MASSWFLLKVFLVNKGPSFSGEQVHHKYLNKHKIYFFIAY